MMQLLRNLIKLSLIYLILVSSLSSVIGQKISNSNNLEIENLANRFISYSNQHLQEKIYIHTDRSSYITGETIWLKVYCVDGSFHHPLTISKVVYLELLDDQHQLVLQNKLAINEDGTGNGAIFLPASLQSGRYLIRAYTNWMKNVEADLYYHQPITIINPFVNYTLNPPEEKTKYDIQFFPEGGNLVNGLQSVVGFRAVNQYGKGIEFGGVVVNENNDTVTTFRPLKFGIGRFTFLPSKKHTYRAIITDTSQNIFSYPLPVAYDEGVVLHLTETSDSLKIEVKAAFTSNANNASIHLLTHTRNTIITHSTQLLQGGKTVFFLNKNLLGEGISHLTVFDDRLIPVCERLYFKKPTNKPMLEVNTPSVTFGIRKKVNIPIHANLMVGHSMKISLSASIYKMDSLAESKQNIISYLLLTSELKGNIESPEYYFEPENIKMRIEATDNLMLTHGWIRFKWEDVILGNKQIKYAPEYNGHIIKGRVIEKSTGTPAKSIWTYLTTTGINARPYSSFSNGDGGVLFETHDFVEQNELLVQLNTQYDSLYRVDIFDPFSEKKSSHKLSPLHLSQYSKNMMEQRSIHMQVQNIFFKNQLNKFKKHTFDSMAFYGLPDKKYNLDDYTRFATMEEVMREFVKGVLVRKQNDTYRFSNYDLISRTYFDTNPFVLLDGVPVFTINKIIALDPNLVKSLEVVNRRYYLGASVFEGIINYETYRGDMGGLPPDAKSLVMKYNGLQSEREFFHPLYETLQQQESTIPDTRNLLYWSPSVEIDNLGMGNLNFYTSDITGKYKVVIQGITSDGIPCYSSSTFEVKKKY